MLAARYVWGTYCPTVALEFAVPASRAFWKGYLKLSFVSCPVALYPATSAAERVSFRQVNRRTGHRLRHKLVDSVTGEAVDSSNKARGYEVGENEFLLVEDRDLERARSERLPPGAVELAEPPPGASPPTVPAGLHEQDTEENGHDNEEADEIVPRPENTRTIEIERFLQAGRSTPGISRSRTMSCRAKRSDRNSLQSSATPWPARVSLASPVSCCPPESGRS